MVLCLRGTWQTLCKHRWLCAELSEWATLLTYQTEETLHWVTVDWVQPTLACTLPSCIAKPSFTFSFSLDLFGHCFWNALISYLRCRNTVEFVPLAVESVFDKKGWKITCIDFMSLQCPLIEHSQYEVLFELNSIFEDISFAFLFSIY